MSQILDGQINLKDGMTPILNRISKKLKEMHQGMPGIVTGMDRSIDKMKDKLKQYENSIAAHQNKMMANMRNNQKRFIQYLHSTPNEIDRVNAKMTAKSRSMSMHQQNIAMGLASAGAAGGYATYKGGKNFVDFDKELADLRARSIGEIGLIKQQEKQAIQLGMSSRYSATEVLKAKNVLAKAGITGKRSLELTPSVINLASANDLNMEDSAKAMIAAANTFSLKTVPEMIKTVDMLSYTANKTNSDVMGLIKSMNYSGSTAKAFGMTLEENLFFSGKLKDFGLSDSTVGTSMNQFIERILTNSTAQEVMQKELGVDVYERDAKKNPLYRKNIFDIISQMRAGLAKMNIEQGPQAMKKIAETRGFRAISRILSIDPEVLEQARKEYMDYENIRGYASKMEQERLKSFSGLIEKISSAFESTSIAIGQVINKLGLFEWLSGVATDFEDFVNQFLEYNDLLEQNNGNLFITTQLLGDKAWSDSVLFIRGFRDGLDHVVEVFKEGYNNVLDFIGVQKKAYGPDGLGKLTSEFIGFTSILTPLGILLFFTKNVIGGLYSSFALLTDIMKHAANGVSMIGNIFYDIGEDVAKPFKGKKNRQIISEAIASAAGEVGAESIAGRSYSGPSAISTIRGDSRSETTIKKLTEQATKKNKVETNAINTITNAMTGASTISGATTLERNKGKLVKNAILNSKSVQDMKSATIGAASLIDDITTTANPRGNFTTSKGVIPNAVHIVSGLMNAGLPAMSASAKGIGAATVKDVAKVGIGQKMKNLLGVGVGGIGAIASNYLSAVTLGNEGVQNMAQKATKKAIGKANQMKSTVKTLTMTGLELLPFVDFGGGQTTTNPDGTSRKIHGTGKEGRARKASAFSKLMGKKFFGAMDRGEAWVASSSQNAMNKLKSPGKLLKGAGSGLLGAGKGLLKGGMAGLLGGFSGLLSLVTSLGSVIMTVISTALSPFMLILGTITVVGIALFTMLKKDGESWGEMFGRILNNIVETAMFLWKEVFVPFGQGLAEAFGPTIKMIQERFRAIGEMFSPVWERIKAMFGEGESGSLSTMFKKIGEAAGWLFEKVLTPAINVFMAAVELLVGLLGDALEIFTSIATGNWSNAGKSVLRMFVRIIQGVFSMIAGFIDGIFNQIGIDSGLQSWVKANIDPDAVANAIFGDTSADLALEAKRQSDYLKEQAALMPPEYDYSGQVSSYDTQGMYNDVSSPLEEYISTSSEDEDADRELELRKLELLERQANASEEGAAAAKKTANKDCETTLDGKKISQNQARHSAIVRAQGKGRHTLRNSKTQGRIK